jgi:hypothetical protein
MHSPVKTRTINVARPTPASKPMSEGCDAIVVATIGDAAAPRRAARFLEQSNSWAGHQHGSPRDWDLKWGSPNDATPVNEHGSSRGDKYAEPQD